MGPLRTEAIKSLFNAVDNTYRDTLNKYYTDRDMSCRYNQLLYMLCAHQNISSITEELEKCAFKYNAFQGLDKIFDSIYQTFDGKILRLPKVDNITRQENILQVNKQQLDFLSRKNNIIKYMTCPDKDNDLTPEEVEIDVSKYIQSADRQSRSLTLYYRRETLEEGETPSHIHQVDYFEFCIISYIIGRYITGGYSRVFNKLKIVSREPDIYPHYVHDVVPECSYVNVGGTDFIAECCVLSNTIYFVNGSSPDRASHSMPIFCNCMLLDSNRAREPHIRLDLSYYIDNEDDYVVYDNNCITVKESAELHPELNTDHTIHHIINSTIHAITSLEDTMLKYHNQH